MNKLMFALFGAIRYMAEEGGTGGGEGGTGGEGGAGGEGGKSALELKGGEGGEGGAGGEGGKKPTEISDEDFLKGITADDETKKAAGEGNFEISKEMMKNLLPSIREAGLNPEQTNKLANALAREQLSQMKAYREEQMKDMREGNDAAFKAFPEKRDWELMKVARDHFFKPTDEKGNGGMMLHTIATSGLGNDLEFLALLKFAGEKLATDTTPSGGAAGSGKKNVSYAAALGLK